jgi:SAM-dependent methyltransferase
MQCYAAEVIFLLLTLYSSIEGAIFKYHYPHSLNLNIMIKLISGADNLPCRLSAPSKTARNTIKEAYCTLCGSGDLSLITPKDDKRQYYLCGYCKLIFTDEYHLLNPEEEKSRYQQHNNSITEPGYVKFLNRVIHPSLEYINKNMKGLDYGCGPGPVLSMLLHEKGIHCDIYDPFFYPDYPEDTYNFIFSTETFEHFHDPRKEIEKINHLLDPEAFLFIMTERWESLERFETWYYKNDPTHVCFYHDKTFDFIASEYNLKKLYCDRNRVMILKKK